MLNQQIDYQAKQAAKNVLVSALQANNPQLVATGSKYDCVVAAKNIRIELKKAFPNIKFTVRTDRYSMGNSINIGYVDGVARVQVEAIVNKYKYGHFNSMEDIYEYEQNYWTDAFGGSKYIFVNRDYSVELLNQIRNELVAEYGTIDGEDCPKVEDLRRGAMLTSPWERVWNLAVTDKSL